MNRLVALVRQSPLVAFFVLAYVFTWLLIVPVVLVNQFFALLALFAPAAAGVVVTAAVAGRDGVKAYLRRAVDWRVGLVWYVVAIGLPILLALAVLAARHALAGTPFAVEPQGSPALTALLGFLVVGEELGWRGFALPHLQQRYGALRAALLLGALWAIWHLPNALIPGLGYYLTEFPSFFLWVVAMTVLFTWIANHTRGSVLLAWLFHAAINISGATLTVADAWPQWWLAAAVYGVAALGVVTFDRAAFPRPVPGARAAGRRGLRAGTVLASVAALPVVIGLGSTAYQTIASEADARRYPPPGRLVDVGGYRLHLYCTGEGQPAVILNSASLDTVSDWVWMLPEVARETRVCAYDRAGLGWSDPGTGAHDALQNALELHTLLERAGVPGPYVVVGHSFGGLYARVYAGRYPDDVAGAVLIEATAPDFWARQGKPDVMPDADPGMLGAAPYAARLGLLRLMQFVPIDANLPERSQAELRAFYASAKFADTARALYDAFPVLLEQTRQAGDLGGRPLAVVVGGASENASGLAGELQDELVTLSPAGIKYVVPGADHVSLVRRQAHALQTAEIILRTVRVARGSVSAQP